MIPAPLREINSGAGFFAVDRFLLPRGAPEISRYFLDRLFVSHGLKERMSRMMMGPGALGRRNGAGSQSDSPAITSTNEGPTWDLSSFVQEDPTGLWTPALALLEEFSSVHGDLEQAGMVAFPLRRTILLRDYAEAARARLLLFPFQEGSTEPSAVIKLKGKDGAGRSLKAERESLLWIKANAQHPRIQASVPEVIGFGETPHVEVLALSHLNGRSAYWDQQNRLFPKRTVRVHLEAAVEWLVAFHHACGVHALDETGPSHGDYWSRNLLIDSTRSALERELAKVVDWESFDPAGAPSHDLFHFPLTYVQNFPWQRYGRLPFPQAFRKGFLDRTPVSLAIEDYFSRYSAAMGLRRSDLEGRLRDHLRSSARETEGSLSEQWGDCVEILESSASVVSRCGH